MEQNNSGRKYYYTECLTGSLPTATVAAAISSGGNIGSVLFVAGVVTAVCVVTIEAILWNRRRVARGKV